VNKVYITTVGNGGVNAGTINFTHSNTSALCAQIEVGEGCSHAAVYSVPNNYTLFISSIEGHIQRTATDTSGQVAFYRRNGAGGPLWQCFQIGVSNKESSVLDLNHSGYFSVNEKSDIYVNVIAITASNTVVSSVLRGVIVLNSHLDQL
jgi:hypothetical protein